MDDVRRINNSQLSWMAQAEADAVNDDLTQLLSETRGVLEKLAEGALKLGKWQMVLWQPRWFCADTEGVLYQKVTGEEKPIGKPKRILYSSIQQIEELEHCEFVLECSQRDYTFKASTENQCRVIVHNLRTLKDRAQRSATHWS